MNLKYGIVFIFLAAVVIGGCFILNSPMAKSFSIYVAVSFLACGSGYFLKSTWVWQKRVDGTISPSSFWFFAPLHGLNWLSLWLAVRMTNEKPVHEIAPKLWLGRRLIANEANIFILKSDVAVLDLTSEFPENKLLRSQKYLCLPTLDHTAPNLGQLKQALTFINQHISDRPVFIHCALGHGRSATVAAAWLLTQPQYPTVEAAVNQIKTVRSKIRLNACQITMLKELTYNKHG